MRTTIHSSLRSIKPDAWNCLCTDNNPFLKHEFLIALENNQCLQPFGWQPRYLAAYGEDEELLGAVPMYMKDNSYGELVFDWAWAEAYQRADLPYYPKLVVAIPYTPATSQRILIREDCNQTAVSELLINNTIQYAKELDVSSLHWLFPPKSETEKLEPYGYMRRTGCQYHWKNHNFKTFDDFLGSLNSSKRKKIKRERRHVTDADIEIQIVRGDQATDKQIQIATDYYIKTFNEKWGTATLNHAFFKEISSAMGEQLLFFFARHKDSYVACAICFRSDHTLYGRHWGCSEEFNSLHFECCYCIREGLDYFDPGAQGEHKISRGFLPTPTWSSHWISNDSFRIAIKDFLDRETTGMMHYIEEMTAHSPYKKLQKHEE